MGGATGTGIGAGCGCGGGELPQPLHAVAKAARARLSIKPEICFVVMLVRRVASIAAFLHRRRGASHPKPVSRHDHDDENLLCREECPPVSVNTIG